MEQVLSFDKLPEAVAMLTKEVSELKRLLIEKQEQPPTEQPDQLLTIQEAAEFLNLSVPTLYTKVHNAEIPVYKKTKRLYFSKQELTDWIKAGRKKTNAEIEQEAKAYLLNNKKGLNYEK